MLNIKRKSTLFKYIAAINAAKEELFEISGQVVRFSYHYFRHIFIRKGKNTIKSKNSEF